MLLGALFGYLLVWSNSLWFPILAHFINNASIVIAIYIGLKEGKTLESLEETQKFPNAVYISSAVFTVLILWVFYQYSRQKAISKTEI